MRPALIRLTVLAAVCATVAVAPRAVAQNPPTPRPQPAGQAIRDTLGAALSFFASFDHGFHADYRPSYRQEAADDAWKQLTGWFKKYKVLS